MAGRSKINTFFTPLDANPNPPLESEKQFWQMREHVARSGYLSYLGRVEYRDFPNLRRQSPALLSLCSVLRDDGHKVGYFIPDNDEINPSVAGKIADCDILLMTSFTANFDLAVRYARYFKQINPRIFIGIGGHHAPYLPESSLVIDGERVFDFTVRGYAENGVRDIASGFDKSKNTEDFCNVPQTTFIDSRGKSQTNPRLNFPDLDKLPLPANDLIPTDHLVAARVFTAYGCPFNCQMCNLGQHASYSERPLKLFEEEVRFLKEEKGVRYFYIGDPTLAVNLKRFGQVVKILKKFPEIRWGGQTRLPIAQNPDFLAALRGSNCVHMEVGVETFSQKVLDKIRKRTHAQMTEDILYGLAKNCEGMDIEANFLFGSPGSDEESIRFDIEKMRQFASMGISIHLVPFVPFPGTPVFEHPERFGIKIEADDFSKYAFRNGVGFSHVDGLSRDALNQLYEDGVRTLTNEMRKKYGEVLGKKGGLSSEPF